MTATEFYDCNCPDREATFDADMNMICGTCGVRINPDPDAPEVPATNDPYLTDQEAALKVRREWDSRPEVPADEGTHEDRLRIAMLGNDEGGFIDPSSEIPAGEMFRLASECLATELQKARAESDIELARTRAFHDCDGTCAEIDPGPAIHGEPAKLTEAMTVKQLAAVAAIVAEHADCEPAFDNCSALYELREALAGKS